MAQNYPDDLIDGRRAPPKVITSDETISGEHKGTVHVEAGHLTLTGRIAGTLILHPGSRATITGKQNGTLQLSSGVTCTVTGEINGTTNVERDATVIIEAGGKLAGTLANDGLVVVRGVFGGAQSGRGELRIEDQGNIKKPKQISEGVYVYEW